MADRRVGTITVSACVVAVLTAATVLALALLVVVLRARPAALS